MSRVGLVVRDFNNSRSQSGLVSTTYYAYSTPSFSEAIVTASYHPCFRFRAQCRSLLWSSWTAVPSLLDGISGRLPTLQGFRHLPLFVSASFPLAYYTDATISLSQAIKSRYGLRVADGERAAESSQSIADDEDNQRPLSSYLVGPFLDDALAKDGSNSIEVFWPFEEYTVKEDGSRDDKVDWRGREAILWVSF